MYYYKNKQFELIVVKFKLQTTLTILSNLILKL